MRTHPERISERTANAMLVRSQSSDTNNNTPPPSSVPSREDDGREKERRIEKAVAETLKRVSEDDIDLTELRLVLRRYRNVDAALEAHRLAQWASAKSEKLTFPLRMLERWLDNARPMAEKEKPAKGKRLTEAAIARRVAGRRELLSRCLDWEGTLPEGTLREVPAFSEAEIDELVGEFEADLRRHA